MVSAEVIKTSVFVVAIAVVSRFVANTLMYLDLNKRVYNHVPGSCSGVAGIEHGAADMAYVKSLGVVLITSGLRILHSNSTDKHGAVYSYNVTGKSSWETKLESKSLTPKSFNPQGISVWESGKQVTVFVVNHRKKWDTIEVFRYKDLPNEKTLKHVRTVRSPLFTSIRDIAAVSAERFFATSNYYFKPDTYLRAIEMYTGASLGSVLYFDGKNATYSQRWMANPSSVALDAGKKYLYVSSLSSEKVIVYEIEHLTNGTLKFSSDIKLDTNPDQITIDPYTADIYVACHPIKSRYFFQLSAPPPNKTQSPSQVLRIRGRPSKANWNIVQIYANDGATLSGSSVAFRFKDSMIIGSLYDKLITCDLDFPPAYN